jgi:hypothetical protein
VAGATDSERTRHVDARSPRPSSNCATVARQRREPERSAVEMGRRDSAMSAAWS